MEIKILDSNNKEIDLNKEDMLICEMWGQVYEEKYFSTPKLDSLTFENDPKNFKLIAHKIRNNWFSTICLYSDFVDYWGDDNKYKLKMLAHTMLCGPILDSIINGSYDDIPTVLNKSKIKNIESYLSHIKPYIDLLMVFDKKGYKLETFK